MPVSPSMSTGIGDAAALSIRRKTSRIAGATADHLREAIEPGEIAAQRTHLRAQPLLGRVHRVEPRVLDRDGDAARERLEEIEVVVVKRSVARDSRPGGRRAGPAASESGAHSEARVVKPVTRSTAG